SNQLNKDTIEATAKCFTNDLSMSSDYYNDLQLWPKEVNDIKDTINPTLYFTNQLLFRRYTK
ncbi:ABC transporter substrate-binding protein, partial [Staphylococcus capitis]